jgi:hypothetical protein
VAEASSVHVRARQAVPVPQLLHFLHPAASVTHLSMLFISNYEQVCILQRGNENKLSGSRAIPSTTVA